MAIREQMAPGDISWLRMDRPTNRMVVLSVLILAQPLPLARLERTITSRLLVNPRFRQRIERSMTGYWWHEDSRFDIARHIKRVRLPGAGDKPALERFVAELAPLPLDEAHPLWQIHVVEDYDGGSAIIWRSHHALADGMALVRVLLSLTDDGPDTPENAMPQSHRTRAEGLIEAWPAVMQPVTSMMLQGMRVSAAMWRGVLDVMWNPAKLLQYGQSGAGVAGELAYLLTMRPDSKTRFKGKPKGQKRVAWTDPLPLPEVKAVGRVLDCSVNDLLLASVTGALRSYLAKKGDATENLELRAMVPVNLRAAGTEMVLGNQFGVVGIALPLGIENPLARVYEVRRRMTELKQSYEPLVTLGLFAALGYAPKLVQDQLLDLLTSRSSAVMTNVPGPQHPLFLAGVPIRQMMFWVPQSGDVGMGISILSFDGQVQFGLMTDAALVPDPETIIEDIRVAFDKLLYFVLTGAEASVESLAQPAATASA